LVLAITAGLVTRLLYAKWTDSQLELGAEMLVILSGLIPLNTLTGYLFSVYHARQRYLLPALSGLVGPALTVGIVALFPKAGVRGIAWAVVIGGMAGVALLLPGFPAKGQKGSVPLKKSLMRFGGLLWPLILGAAFFRLDPIVDRHLAVAGELSEGSISHLGYAGRLISAIAVLGTSGLSVVAFPAMARHAASGEKELFASEIAHGFRFLCVVLVPIIGGLLCYADTLVAWLLERGEFTPRDTKAVAGLLCLYVGVILAGGYGEIATRAFYALGRTWVPTVIGMLGFAIGSAAKFALVSRYQVQGLAGLTSAYYLLVLLVSGMVLRLLVGRGMFLGLGWTFLRTLFCTACALGIVWPILRPGKGIEVPLGIALAIASYGLLQWGLKDEFALRLWQGTKVFLGRCPRLR
jgi:putative peptidoglycan lipid II flippase